MDIPTTYSVIVAGQSEKLVRAMNEASIDIGLGCLNGQ